MKNKPRSTRQRIDPELAAQRAAAVAAGFCCPARMDGKAEIRPAYAPKGRSIWRMDICASCATVLRQRRSRWKSRTDRAGKIHAEIYRQSAKYRRQSWQHANRERELATAAAKAKKDLRDPVLRLLRAMREVEQQAAELSIPASDDRSWKYHPVAIKWRRLLRRWWATTKGAIPVQQDDCPKQFRGSIMFLAATAAGLDGKGSAPDVQAGRVGKIQKMIRAAGNPGPDGEYRIGNYQFTLFDAGRKAIGAEEG